MNVLSGLINEVFVYKFHGLTGLEFIDDGVVPSATEELL